MNNGVKHSRIVVALSSAGLFGPVIFWIILLIAQHLHPGYDAWENSVSRLIFDPFGWLQTVNFYLITLFAAAFGAAIYIGIAKSPIARTASCLFILMGLAQLLTAVYQVDVNPNGLKSLAYIIHNLVFLVSAGSFPIGTLLLMPTLWSNVRWRTIAYFTIPCISIVLALELLWLISRPFAPHLIDPWFGFYERVLFSIPFIWMMSVSARLLYLNRRGV